MTEPKDPTLKGAAGTDESSEDEVERTRQLILQRRNRFIAAALAGIGAAAQGCSDTHAPGGVPVLPNAGQQSATSGRPSVCLTPLQPPVAGVSGKVPVAGTPAANSGSGAAGVGGPGASGSGGAGGAAGQQPPRVCLSIPACPGGKPTPPCVCLSAPIDQDAGTE